MIKYNKHTLQKLETIFKESEIQVRYGKGSFSAGYCILENKNIVVVNKYYTVESRVGALIELLDKINIKFDCLSESSLGFLQKVQGEKREQASVEEAETELQ